MVKQEKGDSWAIRKPLHKDTVSGEVNLRDIKTVTLKDALKNLNVIVEKDVKKKLKELLEMHLSDKQIKQYFEAHKETWRDVDLKKIKVYYFTKETKDRFFAVRTLLDTSFNQKKIIGKVTDTGIQKILLRHLEINENDVERAFSSEGIERMNKNIVMLNNGKWHQPIYKVRIYEKADKFAVGQTGNKSSKFVEAAKGTNLFFAVYETEQINQGTGEVVRKRNYATVPLNVVIDRQKRGLPSAPEDKNGNLPKFVLSPNDLVYIPTQEELETGHVVYPLDKQRIYKMVSCTGNQCFFIQSYVANAIVDKCEYSVMNKMERAITGEMIKEICFLVRVDRLGNLKAEL